VGQNGAGHDADSRGHPPEEPLDGGLHLAKKKKKSGSVYATNHTSVLYNTPSAT
jgi:hypothetical protein